MHLFFALSCTFSLSVKHLKEKRMNTHQTSTQRLQTNLAFQQQTLSDLKQITNVRFVFFYSFLFKATDRYEDIFLVCFCCLFVFSLVFLLAIRFNAAGYRKPTE